MAIDATVTVSSSNHFGYLDAVNTTVDIGPRPRGVAVSGSGSRIR